MALTLGQVLALYAAGLGTLLLLLSAAGLVTRRWRSARARRRLIQCAHCGTIYENAAPDPLPPCPLCARPNERVPPSGV